MRRSASSHRSVQSSPAERALVLWPEGWRVETAVMVGAALYVLAHILVRIPFSDVVAVDWVGETLYAQTIDWGQTPKYPPLPAWALWTVHQITGPGVLSTLVVKYAVLWAAFVAYFFASRRVLGHDGWSVLAVLCVLLLFQIGWNIHEGVTHTVFLVLAAPLTLLAALNTATAVSERQKLLAYVLAGVAVAIGALAKQAYFAGLAALVLALLVQPGYRAAVVNWRVLIAGAVAVALAGPHYVWALSSGFDFGGAASVTLAGAASAPWHLQVLSGLWSSIRAPLLFLLPLLPILILLVPRAFRPSNALHPGAHGVSGQDPVRLVRDTVLFGIVVLVVPVFVAGVSHYGERWMHPLMLLAPIYLVAMVRAARPSARRIRTLLWLVAGLSLVAVGWRLAGFVYPSQVTCGKCRLEVPYAALADRVADMGFVNGTILAGDEHIAGNLRTHFPKARVVALNYGYYDPPMSTRTDRAQACVVVWRSHEREATAVMPPLALAYAELAGLPEEAAVQAFSLPHGHRFLPDDYAVSRFAAVLMPASGPCR